MAIQNFPYRIVRQERFEHFIKWFQNTYQLRDWDIDLETGNVLPDFFKDELDPNSPGKCHILSANMKANIWVNIGKCKELDLNPLEVLVHEMLHVLVDASQIDGEDDLLIYRIQGTILEKYAEEQGLII
jgi:hypothetical protein